MSLHRYGAVMRVSEAQVLQYIAKAPHKVSFTGLQRHFCVTHQIKSRALKNLVAGMVHRGDLRYTTHFGNSYLERSYDLPRAVSKHVVLKPPMTSWHASAGQRAITLASGASFGVGEHPTTRLAIQLIDSILHASPWKGHLTELKAIDIGTGSGVLAIVAATLGLGRVDAIDTDPCAVFETRHNIQLNQLKARVEVLDDPLENIDGIYDLVLANLRTPTLLYLRDHIEKKITDESALIFSGIKTDETASVGRFYKKKGFYVLKKRSEQGWSAICLLRGDFKRAGGKHRP